MSHKQKKELDAKGKKKITTMPQGYLRRRKKGDKNGDIIQMAETIRTKDTSIQQILKGKKTRLDSILRISGSLGD